MNASNGPLSDTLVRFMRRIWRLALWSSLGPLAFAAISPTHSAADDVVPSKEHAFRVEVLTRGLEHPWSLTFLPDRQMLVTERPGRLRLIAADGQLDPQPIEGVPSVVAQGQGGLFDVALHPQFAENHWVYLAFAGGGPGGVGTELIRGRLRAKRLEEVTTLFRMQPKSHTFHHFGGRIVFDTHGFLYLTLGDRGGDERAQRLDDHAGALIRLHDDGRVPTDNPYIGTASARPEIYSMGHRNMQGAAIQPATGTLWTHEHGPQGGDELNVIRPGTNYGWPVITYGVQYVTGAKIGEGTSKIGMAQPVYYWKPSIGPSGLAFYQGDAFPRWRGDALVGSLRDQMLVRLRLVGEKVVYEERVLQHQLGRIRDVRVGPDGLVYLLTDDANGTVVRLTPASR